MEFKGIKYVLMDIEGTTSDIHFVKKVMFPYAQEKLPTFLEQNKDNPEIQELIADISLDQLNTWIDEDIKHPVLKKLQGLIWKEAFESGAFKAPLYKDVLPAWALWKEKGLRLGIYSSGSVGAQKLFFSHSIEGNVLEYLENHFDLDIGSKKESKSYSQIAENLALSPNEILFLSDVAEELIAAQQAQFNVAHILRPGTEASQIPGVHSFSDLELTS